MLFKDERFGVFLHFGLYSQTKWHEQAQMRLGIPKGEYVKFAETFDPSDFVADDWVRFAKESGALLNPITAVPSKVTLLNDGSNVGYEVEYNPFDYNGRENTPHLRIYGLPSEKLMRENMVVKIEFPEIDTVFKTVTGKTKIIL